MSLPMSGVPAPNLPPRIPSPGPVPVPTRPAPVRRPTRWLVLGALLATVGGLAYWRLNQPDTTGDGGGIAGAMTRTAAVSRGRLDRYIRLTGSTAAENYVSIIAPPMRGSRSFGGFTGDGMRGMGGSRGSSGGSSGGGSSSSGSSSSSSSPRASSSSGSGLSAGGASSGATGAGGGGESSVASTAFATPGSTTRTVRGATTRSFSSASRSTRSSSGSTASSLNSGDIGSTGNQIPGSGGPGGGGGGGGGGGFSGGGMRGGGSDFMMVIHSLAPSGTLVKKGDIVAEFDRQFALLRLDDYKATLETNESSYKRLEADLEVSRKAHDQLIRVAKNDVDKAALDLKTLPVRSAIDAERLKLAYEEAQAHYKQLLSEVKYVRIGEEAQRRNAKLELEQTRIEVKRAEANAERLVSRAPIDGLVVIQNTFRGTEFGQIQQGDQIFPGMLFMQIVDPRSMVINATVNQVDVEQLRVGNKARVRFDAYPGLELPAKIVSVGAITRTGGFRPTYFKEVPVRLKLDQMDPRVIPDLSVSCDVLLESEEDTILAPRESVFTENGKSFVYVRNGSGFERRAVDLGVGNHVAAAVKSGLRPGDVVALEKPEQGRPGEPPNPAGPQKRI